MKLLWIGDAGCDSGFARCTHQTLDVLRKYWDVAVLGLNYRGDPHDWPYKIYPAYVPGGDLFGVRRVIEVCALERPDCVVIQNDPWNIPRYVEKFEALAEGANLRPLLVGAIAIDGKNAQGHNLNGLDHCIFWTNFAEAEARLGGFTKTSGVVPLGVDLEVYKPGDRAEARKEMGWPESSIPMDAFVVMNVNRNQPRKRLDLTMEYFAEFYHTTQADNAYLFLHVAPTGDLGYDCTQLTKYYGLKGHVMLVDPGPYQGVSEQELANTYRAADVLMSTTQGEGWGLTTLEAMACGIPTAVPDWSALGEWAKGASLLIPCSSTAVTPNKVNVVGGIADRGSFVHALDTLYRVRSIREYYARRGLKLAQEDRFRWSNIGEAFAQQIAQAMNVQRDVTEGRAGNEAADQCGVPVGAGPDCTGAVSGVEH